MDARRFSALCGLRLGGRDRGRGHRVRTCWYTARVSDGPGYAAFISRSSALFLTDAFTGGLGATLSFEWDRGRSHGSGCRPAALVQGRRRSAPRGQSDATITIMPPTIESCSAEQWQRAWIFLPSSWSRSLPAKATS